MLRSELSEMTDKIERFLETLTKQVLKKHSMLVCMVVHRNDEDKQELKKVLANLVRELQRLFENANNAFAILVEEEIVKAIEFCSSDEFIEKLNHGDWQTSAPNRNTDLYKLLGDLDWTNGAKIILDVFVDGLPNSKKDRQMKNYRIDDCFDLFTIDETIDLVNFLVSRSSSGKVKKNVIRKTRYTVVSYNSIPKKFTASVLSFTNELTKDFILSFTGLFDQDDLFKRIATIELEDKPFSSDGNEVYCFKGTVQYWGRNSSVSQKFKKVFKMSKFEEINLENNFAAQTIGKFLAKEFSI